MIAFIDTHRAAFGVGPVCKILQIAPSTYYARAAIGRDPDLASDRAKKDILDQAKITEAFNNSRKRYGARKMFAIGLERMATR